MLFNEVNYYPVSEIYYDSCIYFLLKNNDVVYVGQSTLGLIRTINHKDIDFDNLYYIKCNKNQLNELEDEYIYKYLPKYNKKFNGTLFKKLNSVLQDFIIENEKTIKTVIYNDVEYLDLRSAKLIPIEKNERTKKQIKSYQSLDPRKIIKIECVRQKLTLEKLATSIGSSKQNLCNKMNRNDFKFSDIEKIFSALNLTLKVYGSDGKEL